MKQELLRFNGALQRDPATDAWMKRHSGELGDIAHRWFNVMRTCGDEVRELLHDGCPVARLGDTPFAYVNVFTFSRQRGILPGRNAARSRPPAPGQRQIHAPLEADIGHPHQPHSLEQADPHRLLRYKDPRRKQLTQKPLPTFTEFTDPEPNLHPTVTTR